LGIVPSADPASRDRQDQVRELEMESKRPTQDDSPLTRKIRMLENRLDKAMIKYNEAQSIRKTYEQIVKRLKVPVEPAGLIVRCERDEFQPSDP
jgi:hypothetical protein